MKSFSYEKRYLKRPRLGPPDVYPQEPKQKEDELTMSNVKHGFACLPQLADEFGSAKNCNISASKIAAYYNAILSKKDEKNTLSDSGRKRQQINPKDNFWPVTARTKSAVEQWFKDLAGTKSLLALSKKAPNFNKREDIFPLLCEHQVPLLRAAWFIKYSSAYTVAVSEAKIKKRQMPDPTQEWTGTLLRFLKEQLTKLAEYYNSPTQSTMSDEQKVCYKLYQYTTQLMRHVYQEGLLDQTEVLHWILENVEGCKAWGEDQLLRLTLPLTLQYLGDITLSELLSRKLAYVSASRLAYLANSSPGNSTPHLPGNNSPDSPAHTQTQSSHSNNTMFGDLISCGHHRDIILSLSAIIQTITVDCSTALVWNSIGEGKASSVLNGSPMDLLPCPPSALPVPTRLHNPYIKSQVKYWEDIIKERSQSAENKWSCDKWEESSAGVRTQTVLTALEALDRHSFTRVDANNSLDTLYAKIFPHPIDKATYNVNKDEAIVELLCWWAVRSNRYGEHRAMAVAKLLERRNNCVVAAVGNTSGSGGNSGVAEDESAGQDKDQADVSSLPVFQPLLINFLDSDAPVLEEGCAASSSVQFTNLVHLFAELMRHDVFSHDAYMCTLISRGDLLSAPNINANSVGTPHPNSNKPLETPTTQIYLDSDPTALFDLKPNKMPYGQDHGRMECDDSKIDDDLDKLLQTIKEDQQNSMDAPDSPKVDDGMGGVDGVIDPSNDSSGRPSRHLLYTTHFPLPQDESYVHECNQRHVLLYGVGRLRDDARHAIKRVVKDISKLFSKKFSIDVAEGGKVKKHSRNEFNFESTTTRVENLSYFDQHVITWQCSTTVLEMISSFASGNSNYLPVQEHVAFLFDLMELALNINGLIDVCIQILKEMPEVEAQLVSKGSNLVRSYTSSLVLYIVGVLRRYHSCLLLSGDETVAVFEGLCKVVKHISNPADCSSAERCILSHLYDLYTCCTLLKTRPHGQEPFSNAYPKIRLALYNSPTPSQPGNQSVSCFMADVIMNIRKSMKMENSWSRQLNESASNRYSFVCNVIVAVCTTNDIDRINDLGHLCSELTACCNLLSNEWLGVLMALCLTTNSSSAYSDVLSQVDVQELTLHNSLSLFTSILVGRHCFLLEDFVVHVALPSLMAIYNDGRGDADIDAEAGARLTLHLLLRLFKTIESPQPGLYSVGTSPQPISASTALSSIRLSCDRHLLAAAHHNIKVGPVLAVLKAILVVGDLMAGRGARSSTSTSSRRPHSRQTPPQGTAELSISHILGTSDLHTAASAARDDLMDLGGAGGLGVGGSLSELAQFVLKEMCSEEWVLERCLQRPEELCTQDMLLDSMLSAKQAQRLLHMICYPERSSQSDSSLDHKTLITNILENLELWTLRVSWLDMQLMLKQFSSGSPDLNQWLDTVAKAAINLFNIHSGPPRMDSKTRNQAMWLVAPLIAKMPSNVQGRVLKVAGQVLESCSWLVGGGGNRKAGTPTRPSGPPPTTLVHHHQPFLALVLTCLKGQDDQRETLLNSLHSQLTQALQTTKEDKSVGSGNVSDVGVRAKRGMEEALALRFSLLGGMFDSVQRSSTLTTDWSILLVQLVTHSLIDLNNNSELFYTVIDMLATLIHSNLVSDSQSEKGEENRKHYQNLMKKLKKEVGEKTSQSLQILRQLLPIAKKTCDVIACTQMGLLTDMKGNKINFDSNEKQGLQVVEKQRVSCWDILEGSKNPAPLSWPWFGAVRVERKPLPYEESHRLIQSHTHTLVKSPSHYLDALPLPPEDIDPPKPMKGGMMDSGGVVDSPGRGGKRGGKHPPGGPRPQRKKQAKPGSIPGPQMPGSAMGPGYGTPYPGPPPGGPGQAPQQQWGQPTPPYPPHHPNQQMYYPPQQQMHQVGAPGPGVGGGGGGRVNPSKQALSNLLRMRLPNQYMNQQQPPPPQQIPQNFQSIQRQNMFRQGMGGMGPGSMGQQGAQQPMSNMGPMAQPQQQMFPSQQQMYSNMQQQGMGGQNYGGYSGGGMVTNTGMFPDQTMMRQAEYQQRMRPPYIQGQAPNVTMTSMQGPLSQPAPPYTRPSAPQQPFPPQMSQQRMRLMAMQQQQQQNPQQQPGMMRQMQHPGNQGGMQHPGNQGGMQHPGNQGSMYQQQPPPY